MGATSGFAARAHASAAATSSASADVPAGRVRARVRGDLVVDERGGVGAGAHGARARGGRGLRGASGTTAAVVQPAGRWAGAPRRWCAKLESVFHAMERGRIEGECGSVARRRRRAGAATRARGGGALLLRDVAEVGVPRSARAGLLTR